MSQTLSLYRLQQVDSQLDRAQTRLQTIEKTLADNSVLRLANERANSTKAIYQSAERAVKQADAEAQNQRLKIDQTEASLYGEKGHSPKELLDLQNDVAALKRHLLTLEDIQLEAMQAAENPCLQTRLLKLNCRRLRAFRQNKIGVCMRNRK